MSLGMSAILYIKYMTLESRAALCPTIYLLNLRVKKSL